MSVPRFIDGASLPATTPPPLTGPWSPTDTRIDQAVLVPLPAGHAPEDVAVDPDGAVFTGTHEGVVWRLRGDTFEALADTGGRPLGIEHDPRDGSLIICDAYRGLLRLTPDGELHELTREAAGTAILFCNNAAIARDGTVYFSDSSSRFPLSHWRRDLLEHRPNGRVLAYDPASGTTSLVAAGLYFPNGVALTPDESALLVCETVAHRLTRIALPSGAATVLADLPAYPDNMSSAGDGTFWIALASPRVAIAERLLPHPGIRRVVATLPTWMQPQPGKHTIAAQVDADGTVLRTVHSPAGRYPMLTGVRQAGDTLWFGSLTERSIARVPLN
ncbi:SMP-30/gluconolactonase/LRE family protein [Dactylosporangium sp. NPDC049140]|jgi:sugar lactone lactonase YvrE|uniref:SMP-30/gluconolactonase/LRE family protein n=1 Tax=Dactylosporangium sp. NPDC049140 TaxID=3155647 RepID=UPI0033C20404